MKLFDCGVTQVPQYNWTISESGEEITVMADRSTLKFFYFVNIKQIDVSYSLSIKQIDVFLNISIP